jgi:hypothetical protein
MFYSDSSLLVVPYNAVIAPSLEKSQRNVSEELIAVDIPLWQRPLLTNSHAVLL